MGKEAHKCSTSSQISVLILCRCKGISDWIVIPSISEKLHDIQNVSWRCFLGDSTKILICFLKNDSAANVSDFSAHLVALH